MIRDGRGGDSTVKISGSSAGSTPTPGKQTLTGLLPVQHKTTSSSEGLSPGKRTLTEALPVQRKAHAREGSTTNAEAAAADIASRGLEGAGQSLPYFAQIQASFGDHDISAVRAHDGTGARQASADLGAQAYAFGDSVAFGRPPDLHTAAHEAAHVVQQRSGVQLKGGIDQPGDAYERHADAVADAVVGGRSATPLLDQIPGGGQRSAAVQRTTSSGGGGVTSANASVGGAKPATDKGDGASAHQETSSEADGSQTSAQATPGPAHRWALVATPSKAQLPSTEVGAVSSPLAITLANQGDSPVDIASLEIVLYGGLAAPALPGEFELILGQPRPLRAREAMTVEVVFRPTRVVPHIGARLVAKGRGLHEQMHVALTAMPAPPQANHADQRELSVAEHDARTLEVTSAPSVEHYGDMLAAILAARNLTDRAPNDAQAIARVSQLLEPVARRLDELNDHQGRLGQFGAGNFAGQTTLDISQTAVQSWLRRAHLGARIQTEELVTKFRMGAETIRFLTGERSDAPTLTAFNHASALTGIGAAALVLAPVIIAVAIEELPLLAFVARVAVRRVVLWALTHPAAALAAAEALLGLGVQIGEDGWERFWEQVQDPNGRWFVLMQVLMDYMHVKSSMSGHGEPSNRRTTGRPPGSAGVDSTPAPAPGEGPDPPGARQQLTKLRDTLQHVHDGAASMSDADLAGTTPKARSGVDPGSDANSSHADAEQRGDSGTRSTGAMKPKAEPTTAQRTSEITTLTNVQPEIIAGEVLPQYTPDSGFSGAYDPGSGRWVAVASGNAKLISGKAVNVAPQAGGHRVAEAALHARAGAPSAATNVGFVLIWKGNNTVEIRWNSGTINQRNFGNREAPDQYRAAIRAAVARDTGMRVTE